MSDDPLPAVPAGWTPPRLHGHLDWDDVEEQFSGSRIRATEGVSGLWFPDANAMVVSPRFAHHNDQLNILDQTGRLDALGDSFTPWVWDLFGFGDGPTRAELDFPRSAGGAFQYVSRNDVRPDYVRASEEFTENDVYAVAWAAKRLAVPGESEANVAYLPSSTPDDVTDVIAREFKVNREVRELEDWYRELRFAGQLPDPIINRDGLNVTYQK